MARPLRVEYPGAYYHGINRGNASKIYIQDVTLLFLKDWVNSEGLHISTQTIAYARLGKDIGGHVGVYFISQITHRHP